MRTEDYVILPRINLSSGIIITSDQVTISETYRNFPALSPDYFGKANNEILYHDQRAIEGQEVPRHVLLLDDYLRRINDVLPLFHFKAYFHSIVDNPFEEGDFDHLVTQEILSKHLYVEWLQNSAYPFLDELNKRAFERLDWASLALSQADTLEDED